MNLASETQELTFKCLSYLQKIGYTHFYIQNGDVSYFIEFYDISICLKIIKESQKKKFRNDLGEIKKTQYWFYK